VAVALAAPLLFRAAESWSARRARGRRARRVERRELRDPGRERRAEHRARELLRSCVNDEEWGMYRDLGFIRVTGRLWRKDRASADEDPARPEDGDTGDDERDLDDRMSGDEYGFDGPDAADGRPTRRPGSGRPNPANERGGRLPGFSPQNRRSVRRLPNNEPDTLQRRRREAAAREAAADEGSSRGGAARGSHARGGGSSARGAAGGAGSPADDAPYAYLIYPHKPIVAYVPKTGRLLSEYCVEFPDLTGAISQTRLPDSDDVLAKWMALTGDEERLIRNANMHLPGRQVDPTRVRRDLWRLSEWERQRRGYGPVRAPRS
jgi:hypothetical protein